MWAATLSSCLRHLQFLSAGDLWAPEDLGGDIVQGVGALDLAGLVLFPILHLPHLCTWLEQAAWSFPSSTVTWDLWIGSCDVPVAELSWGLTASMWPHFVILSSAVASCMLPPRASSPNVKQVHSAIVSAEMTTCSHPSPWLESFPSFLQSQKPSACASGLRPRTQNCTSARKRWTCLLI